MSNYEVQYEYLAREFEVKQIEADGPEAAERIAKEELLIADPTVEDFEVVSVKPIDAN